MTKPILPICHVSADTLHYAFRYALGRRTHAVGTVIRDIQHNMLKMTPADRAVMIKEINDAWLIGALGDDIDRDAWVQLLKRLQLIDEANK